ncbi:FtsX-like permease family protein, partial [Candidatus Bathyarchaeota archaeon]
MQPFLRYAVRGLTKRPGRSLFIVFMIAVGIMLMAGTSIAMRSIPSMLEAPIEESNMADFSLTLRLAPKDSVIEICESRQSIEEFEVRLLFRSVAYSEHGWPKTTDILMIGVEAPLNLNRIVMVEGRFFNDGEYEMVVEHDYGVNLLGREVYVETPSGNVTFKIVGTCRAVWMPRWAVSSTAYALVPLSVLQGSLKAEGMINNVLVKVRPGAEPLNVMDGLTADLKAFGVTARSLEGKVIPFVETQSYYNYLVNLLLMIGLSLFAVGLALLYGSLSLMVTQEYKAIGTLKALGATSAKIVVAYSIRGLLLGLIGGCLGSLLGVVAANLILSGVASTNLTVEGMIYTTQSIFQIAKENVDSLVFYSGVGASLSTVLVFP